ncbi:MAG: ABC transporter ATP-binding protein [Acidimicrobiales bacterium]
MQRATIYGGGEQRADHDLRRFPRVLRSSLALVWRAGRRQFLAAIALQVIAGVGLAVQLLIGSRVLATILEADQFDRGFNDVIPGLLALFAVTAVVGFVTSAQGVVAGLLGELTGRHAVARLLDIAALVDLEAYESPEFHDRLQRARMAAMGRPQSMAMDVTRLLGSLIGVAGLLVALAALQPLLLPVIVVAYVPLWLATSRNSRDTYRLHWGRTPRERVRSYLDHVLTGKELAQELRAFALAPYLRRRWERLYDERIAELRDINRHRLRRSLVASVAGSVLGAANVALLVGLLLAGRMSVAAAVAAAVAVQQLNGRLNAVAGTTGMLFENTLFINDYDSFLELAPVVQAARPTGPAPTGFEVLAVEHLSFSYPQTDTVALADISLEVRRGEIVALVGENGSGKTTLAKLLCHLYAPTRGRILWDGVDTAGCDPAALRRHVAVIFQDFARYWLSARENIGAGDHQRVDDLAAIQTAADHSGAGDFLRSLPGGYEALLGRQFAGGHELSVGQWQRVALARVFFRAAPFVILDEPTAALDPRAEHELFERIRAMAAGRTVLLISHRFSSVRSADRIFVLDHGRLVEQGTHDELVAAAGRYAELFSLQASAYGGAARVP